MKLDQNLVSMGGFCFLGVKSTGTKKPLQQMLYAMNMEV